jgi:DTW domain-containing protein YfiP
VVVVKHIKELEGKSTAVHAKLLSDEQVTLEMYDPNDEDRMARLSSTLLTSECVLLFPDSTAKTVPEINWSDIKRLVVIDGTWQQAKSMIQSSHLKHLVHHVKLDANNETLFWRYQRLGPHCLSTIEALYRFSQELTLYQTGKVSSELDDLLYFFSFFYGIIQDDYSRNPDRHYTSKHRQDYIKRSKQ